MAKYIVCPYCKKKVEYGVIRSVMDKKGHVDMPCPGCKRRLAFSLTSTQEKQKEDDFSAREALSSSREVLAELQVIENIFGYAAIFPLYEGLNRVGRYNDRHTDLEVAIRSFDPSLDRNHTLITMSVTPNGVTAIIMDNDSMTGTFINTRELDPGERYSLENGDVITLGATTVIYHQKQNKRRDE
ncbi:FHA domain-containing protein [Porphyromonas circumdentaria]|nr:FHA domain-containing protein [Porphyromonas circumdentaria]MBB6275307.1 uncharacterized protein YbaR (Trm112 family) [Porphyromonas circumdentaria]MDO4722014.1 FHA domain-containing protein [Porphyromonas circumdentaria]